MLQPLNSVFRHLESGCNIHKLTARTLKCGHTYWVLAMFCKNFVYTSTICTRRKHIWQLLVMPVLARFSGPAKL